MLVVIVPDGGPAFGTRGVKPAFDCIAQLKCRLILVRRTEKPKELLRFLARPEFKAESKLTEGALTSGGRRPGVVIRQAKDIECVSAATRKLMRRLAQH